MHTVSSSGSWSHKCVWWLLKMYSTRQHPDNFFCVCSPPRPFTTDSCSTECLTKRSRSRDGGDDDDKSDGAGSQTIRAAEERPGRLEVWAVLQRANSARLGVSVCTNNPACYLCVMSCKHSVSEYDWSTLYCVCVWITAFFHCTIQQPRFLFMSHRAERRDLLLMEYCSFFLIIWQRGEIFFKLLLFLFYFFKATFSCRREEGEAAQALNMYTIKFWHSYELICLRSSRQCSIVQIDFCSFVLYLLPMFQM